MHILMLNHEFPPLGGGGGRVCYEIARELLQNNCKVTVITTNHRNLPAHEAVDGIDVYRVYGKRKNDLHSHVPITMASFLMWGTQKAYQCIQQNSIDLVHAYFTIPAGLSGIWLKKRTRLPLVVSPHGSDVPHHNPEKFNLPIRLLAPLIGHVWRKSDRVVAVSDGLRQTALRTAPQLDIDVIHNGIDIQHFSPPQIAPHNQIPQIISVGRLVELKGLDHLLKALVQVKQTGQKFQLQIAGEGPERPRLEKLSQDLGLLDSVTFLGQVTYENLPPLYQQADLFVLPSLAESFGQVFAEAMACGVPVIGSTTGGIPEVVGPHQHKWLISPGDVLDLTQKITALLKSPQCRQELSQNNVRYVRQHFTWSQSAQAYCDVYKDVIYKTQKANHA